MDYDGAQSRQVRRGIRKVRRRQKCARAKLRDRRTAPWIDCTRSRTHGEGGMLTGPPELIAAARIWSLHGMSRDAYTRYSAERSWFYEVVAPGFKYNMSDIQAAIGIRQLQRLRVMQKRRQELVGI